MPSSLKECFGYCSLFQKDEEIEKEKLMYHWIAHGFIQSPNRYVELEDVCETYLEELLRRSFLEYVDPNNAYKKKNDEVFYKMHDLVHDLATYVVGDEILIAKGENVSEASHRVRHVFLDRYSIFPKDLLEGKNLKTIMSGEKLEFFHNQRIRVLDYINAYQSHGMFKSIGKLKYIRYLKVKSVWIIPESLCELLNLQYLDLCFSYFATIPENIGNLRNLRVLKIESSELICLPEEIRSLTSLRKLKIVSCYYLRSLGTGLGHITSLEHLAIIKCEELEFSNSDFQGLTRLKYLELWGLDGLKQLPPGLQDAASTLKHLKLCDCINLKLTEEVLPNLTSLELLDISNCRMTTCLPEGMQSLGKLNHLEIVWNPSLEKRCKPTGEDWPKISHVPHIFVKGRDVRSP